jgi:protein-tyrosine phosphatase
LRLLFVCTANICRSPTAEGVMRKMLATAGLQGRVEVASAGTQAMRGSPADPRAVRAGIARGYDLSKQRARQLTQQDFAHFNHILVMDQGHLAAVERERPPGAATRVDLLLRFARQSAGQTEVPDPYYGAPQGFEDMLNLIEDGCAGMVQALQAAAPR